MPDAVKQISGGSLGADILHLLNQHQGGVVQLHQVLGGQAFPVPLLPVLHKDALAGKLGGDALVGEHLLLPLRLAHRLLPCLRGLSRIGLRLSYRHVAAAAQRQRQAQQQRHKLQFFHLLMISFTGIPKNGFLFLYHTIIPGRMTSGKRSKFHQQSKLSQTFPLFRQWQTRIRLF